MKHAMGSEEENTDSKVSLNNQKRTNRSCDGRITPMAHKVYLCRGKENKLLLFLGSERHCFTSTRFSDAGKQEHFS